MNIEKHVNNGQIKVKVIPNSKQNKLVEENNQLKLYIKAVPDKNKANHALIKFFKKKFNLKVEIKFGIKNRNKVLRITS